MVITNGIQSQPAIFPNPPSLPSRFQIRRLEPKHIPWASAIVTHSNIFHSPVWSVVYPENRLYRAKRCWSIIDYLVRHQVNSGYSFGVFDTAWTPKRSSTPFGQEDGGQCYWNEFFAGKTEDDCAAIGDEKGEMELSDAMDFPLVSVALSYDQVDELDHDELAKLIAVLPLFGTCYGILKERDQRPAESWSAKGKGEVLMRNATSTRRDFEGFSLMKNLAQFLMRHAAGEGFRGINIECAHPAVTKVWLNPPPPFKSELVSSFDCATYEGEDESGNKVLLFKPSKTTCTKIYVTLK